MTATEKSRVPLPISTALERMNLPSAMGTPAAVLGEIQVPRRLLQDFRPLLESLEWMVARARWDGAGLLPFVESEVPFLINNNGRLSADAARVFFANCLESEPLPPAISILEVGAGTGLFARYFLDHFQALCLEQGKDFYGRLTYITTDRSACTAAQWSERGLFDAHRDRVLVAVLDPASQDSLPLGGGQLRAVFCNYVLDVMPSTVVKSGTNGPEELCVRTYLTKDHGLIAQYTPKTSDEIAALAASGQQKDLAELVPLLPLLEFEAAFVRVTDTSFPFIGEALAFANGSGKMLLNYGAVAALERFMQAMHPSGFVLINDYGPVLEDQIAGFCSLQRFGATVAFGINFPLLEHHCATRSIFTSKAEGDDQRGIHSRLLSRAEVPITRKAFLETFSAEAQAYYDVCVEQARAHASAGRLNEAVDAYRAALTRCPFNWHLIGEAGEFLALQLRNFEAGLELLRAAVALNPFYSPWLWNALGDCLYCLQRYEDAHQAYLQAARIDPEDVRTNLNLAYTLAQSGLTQQALEAIARGLTKDSGEAYRTRLLEKQRQILELLSNRWRNEQEQLRHRASRLQSA